MDFSKITNQLIKLQNNAYVPYSNFRVAAILETSDGNFIKGVNVENASYPLGCCAERNAFNTAVTLGYKRGDFKALYLMCDSEKVGSPCGGCRQVIAEFCNDDTKIYLFNNTGKIYEEHTISSLLPHRFEL